MKWWIYMIDRDGRLYTGITTDIANRMRQRGQSAPLYREGPMSRADAVKREKELKGWNRKKKEELIDKATEQIK
ncbi:MAG: GIY-YIG nuclease family protein [Nitrospirae bacterium]|nr:GIY-YIG nuclease family protein [Nitrospirota bacterium]NTW67561.1 GIY-YIG nuclease family protein [Nitrospirota bacterium]